MESSKGFQGWIYAIENKINGKLYIGRTVDFSKRKFQHFNNETCPVLKAAFFKYGIANFDMYEILTFKAVNKDVLDKCLNALERLYIKKYDTFNTGYNATLGGDGTCGHIQSEDTKDKIGYKQRVYKAQEWVKQKDRERMLGNTLAEEFKRPILRYDLSGRFIKEYSWIGEAIEDIINNTKYTNNWRTAHSNIIRALAGNSNKRHCNKAYDCMWRYKDSNVYEVFIEPFRRKGEKPLYHYTKDGKLIEHYRTLKEAEKATGLSVHTLKYMSYNGDLRRRENRPIRKDYWSRIAPVI